jgi:cytochrome P450
LTETQERHTRLRRAIIPAFSDRALREQEPYFKEHSDKMIKVLRERSDGGKTPIDATLWYNLVAFDIVSELAFGTPSGYLDSPDQPWIKAILARHKAIVWFQLAVQYGFLGLLQYLTPKYVAESQRKHLAMTQAKVKQRLECKNPGKDFMSYICKSLKSYLTARHISTDLHRANSGNK